jgi:hypothetical protein
MIKYEVVLSLRQIFTRYWPPRTAVKHRRAVKITNKKKNGEDSKRSHIEYLCEDCDKPTRVPDIHHDPPIGEMPGFPPKNGELELWMKKLFCEENKLVCLCKDCHKLRHKEKKK